MKVLEKFKSLFEKKNEGKEAKLAGLYAARDKALKDYQETKPGSKESVIAATNIKTIEQSIAMVSKGKITVKDVIPWLLSLFGIGVSIYGIGASYYATKEQKDTNQQIIDIEAESCGYVRSTALNTKYNNKVAK